MPREAPTLTSRIGIERRNAVEAQSPIKPTMRSQRRSCVGAHRVHLGRLTGSKATELVWQRVQTELVEALTPVFQQSLRCPGTVARTEEGRFVVGIASAS
jgi:hypothetical protein